MSSSGMCIAAIREAGHGGHFFATAHTLANYTTAFYQPLVSDWSNYETWSENGELTAYQRANNVYRQKLEAYQPPPLQASIRSTLESYVTERRQEIRQP